MKRKTVVRNAALLPALLLLAGALAPHAYADIQLTGVISTGNHVVAIDSLEIMDIGGGIWRYRTAGEWAGDTMVVDSFVCAPPMSFVPNLVLLWGSCDASPFTLPFNEVQQDTWYTINGTPQAALVLFHWDVVQAVGEQGRSAFARTGLTVSPSIVRTGAIVRAERVAGTNCAFVIFDAVGNRVRTLRTQTSAGTASVTWTGEDDRGRMLPEGIYYACLDGAAGSSVGKLILSR